MYMPVCWCKKKKLRERHSQKCVTVNPTDVLLVLIRTTTGLLAVTGNLVEIAACMYVVLMNASCVVSHAISLFVLYY